MSTTPINYDALAQQYGGGGAVDYDSLAAQHGAISSPAPQPPVQPGTLDPHGGWMDILRGGARGIESLFNPSTYSGMAQTIQDVMPRYTTVNGIPLPVPNENAVANGTQQAASIDAHPAYAAGAVLGPAILTAGAVKALPVAADAVGSAGTAIRDAAIGDPNVAALKGLRVGAASPKALSTLNAVEGARPYLQGVQSLEDLQARIPQAKAEVWGPYQTVVDAISNKQVAGPDGPTTVGELESQRLQLSALNRGLKAQNPEAIQLAQQKGLTQAQLLQQEQAVKSALDPHLEAAGIKPAEIRKVFGQIAQVGQRVSGKSTLAETSQRYGLGQIANLSLEHPLQAPAQILQGVRDIAAGRPWWKGSPTDVALREAFRNAGPKPDLGTPTAPVPSPLPLGLPAQAGAPYELPYYPQMSPGEQTAALMQYLRSRPPLALPAQAQPIRLPAESPSSRLAHLLSLRNQSQ